MHDNSLSGVYICMNSDYIYLFFFPLHWRLFPLWWSALELVNQSSWWLELRKALWETWSQNNNKDVQGCCCAVPLRPGYIQQLLDLIVKCLLQFGAMDTPKWILLICCNLCVMTYIVGQGEKLFVAMMHFYISYYYLFTNLPLRACKCNLFEIAKIHWQ